MPAFNKKQKKSKKQPENKVDKFNLIPSKITGYKEVESEIYRMKFLTFIASGNNPKTADWLYNNKSLLYTYESIMFKKAIDYELYD